MLSSQIYAEARRLDTTNTIRFNRMTGSLTLKTPIVEFITPEAPKDDKKPEKEYTESELFEISMSNVINNSSWKTSDVLITSPLTLNHTLKRRQKFNPYGINPKFVIFDELDALLNEDPGIRKITIDILKKFATQIGTFKDENSKRQFIFSASTVSDSLERSMRQMFSDL